MSKVEQGTITVVSTGQKVPVLDDDTLNVQRVVIWVANSSTETSAGYYDSSVTFTGSNTYHDVNTSKVITHYRNIGGVKTKVFEGTISYLDVGEFGINVTTLTETVNMKFIVFGS